MFCSHVVRVGRRRGFCGVGEEAIWFANFCIFDIVLMRKIYSVKMNYKELRVDFFCDLVLLSMPLNYDHS